jgi:hypothetical protein
VKAVQQVSEIASPAGNILFRVKRISNIQPHGRLGHELHEADGSRPRDGIRIKIGFGFNDGADESRVELLLT